MEIFYPMDRRFIFFIFYIFLIDIYDDSLKKSLTNFLSFNSSEILKQTLKFLFYIPVITIINFFYLKYF